MKVRTFLIDGERRRVVFGSDLDSVGDHDSDTSDIAFAYQVGRAGDGFTSLGPTPFLERRLALGSVPLLLPFGGKPRTGFREIFVDEPRFGRLWGRFSVDVPVAIERGARFFNEQLFKQIANGNPAGYRVFIMEDGDRYAVRAACIFRVDGKVGTVVELLHDRSLDGLRHASHLLGLALRAMFEAGAITARAAAFSHSGTIPVFVRHAFRRKRRGDEVIVKPVDPALVDVVTKGEGWYVSYLDFLEL